MRRLVIPADGVEVKLVGVTFVDAYPDNLLRIERIMLDTRTGDMTPVPATLVRNPDNEHDSNAIEVHGPTGVGMLGHLPAWCAERLAPELDDGGHVDAWVDLIAVGPDIAKPGARIRLKRTAEVSA